MVGRLIRGSYYKLNSYRFHTAFFLLTVIVLMGITSPHRAKWDFGVYYKAGQNFLKQPSMFKTTDMRNLSILPFSRLFFLHLHF